MAERKPVIPENQLLDLIQNPSKAQEAVQQQKRERSVRGFFSLSALKGRVLFLTDKMAKNRKSPLGLGTVNKLLNAAVIILFVYLVVQFVFAMQNARRVPDFPQVPPKLSHESDEARVVGVSEYTDKPHARDIFKFGQPPKVKVVQAQVEDDVPLEDDEAFLSQFSLVGISFSDDPDVMIKDMKTEEVSFLKRGDWLKEDIKVEAIFRDHVILSYKGKEIELR